LSRERHRIGRRLGAVALVAGIMLLAGISQASFGRTILEKAGLLEQPTNYTSLAFAQPRNLPERLTAKQKTIGILFIIHNSGDSTYGYHWSIQFTQTGHTHRVAAGDVDVNPGKAVTISRTEAIQCTLKQVQVTISLAHPAESIDAWIACPVRDS
jgi:hypothetical protein